VLRKPAADEPQVRIEGIGNPKQSPLGRIRRSALDPADIRLVQTGRRGECGLRQTSPLPQFHELDRHRVGAGVTARGHAEVTALFGGLPLVPPGVVPVTEWRPAAPASPVTPAADLYAGIARTPPHACASTTRLGVLIG